MNLTERVRAVISDVVCPPYMFHLNTISDAVVMIQASMWRVDSVTGEAGQGFGGFFPVFWSTPDDVISKMCLGAALSFAEHEVREAFLYKGRRIFGPHMPLDALWEIAGD